MYLMYLTEFLLCFLSAFIQISQRNASVYNILQKV